MGTDGTFNNNSLSDLLQDLLDGYREYPKGYAVARCPFHDDHNPSLFIDPKTGRFYCKTCREVGGLAKLVAQVRGCGIEEAKGALQTLRKLSEKTKEVEAEYLYFQEDGTLAYKVVRYRLPDGKKSFAFYHYDYDKERWVAGKGDSPNVLYNLSKVLEADTVLVVEGEKCVEALKKYFTATTNPSGAGAWRSEFSKWLEGKTVYLLPDNDEPGIAHMKDVASSLEGKAKAIYWVDLSPYVEEKGDIADLIEEWESQGLGEEEIKERIEGLLKGAEPYSPDKFSLLRQLSLTAELLDDYKAEFLIEDFLPKGAMVLITAKFGGGKSLSALALAKRLTREGHKVLYLDLDNSLSVVKERLTQAELIDSLGEDLIYITRSVHTVHSKSDAWREIKKELKTREHMVIVVDTLKNFSKGMELNSDKEMTEVMSELMDVREAGHTIVILHHLPKKVDDDNPYKNNTTVVDAVDVAYRLHKNGNRLTFECFKDRIPVKPQVSFEIDEYLNLKTALPPKQETEIIIAEAILKLLPPEGRKQGDLLSAVADHLKAHHDDIPHRREKLLSILDKYTGKLWEVIKAEKNAKIYRRLIDPAQFSCFPTSYIYPENRKTQEPQGLDASQPESAIGKLNGPNGLGKSGISESASDEVKEKVSRLLEDMFKEDEV